MNKPLLNNRDEYPDDKTLLKYLGKTKTVWDAFVELLTASFPSMSLEWNFYNDGKSWLCKLVHKKKTICWISIWEKYFKITFYFMDKNDADIAKLNIEQNMKESYFLNKNTGKLKPLTIEVKTKKVLSNIVELIKYKGKLA